MSLPSGIFGSIGLTPVRLDRARLRAHRARRVRRGPTALIATAVLALALGCGGGDGDSIAPGKLTITPSDPAVRVGNTVQLRAEGATAGLTWTSSDEAVATVLAGLVHGVDRGTATITATDGRGSATTKVTVNRPPSIALAAAAVVFGTTSSGAIPAEQTVAVSNAGDESLTNLSVGGVTFGSGASGWLSATLSATSAPATLTLRPNTSALAAGTYVATVSLASTDAVNAPVAVTVTYNVEAAPVIALSRTSVAFTAQAGGPLPGAQQVTITNSGGGTLSGLAVAGVTITNGPPGWLNASISATSAPATLTLQPNTTSLAIGNYTATVELSSTVPGVARASVGVTFTIQSAAPPQSIALSSSALTFSATAGGSTPAAQVVTVSNGGSGTLSGLGASITFTSGQPQGWLTATLNQTTAPAQLTVRPNTVLAAGTYTAQVTVTSTLSGVAPKSIAVTYVVSAPPVISLSPTTVNIQSSRFAAPTAATVGVSNTGGGALTGLSTGITYNPGEPTGWLQATVSSTAPTSPSSTPLTLQATPTPPFGVYTATVTVSSSLGGVAAKTVTVRYTVFPTLVDDVQGIFAVSCKVGCHDAANAPLNDKIDLSTADVSFNTLVGKPSPSFPQFTLVIPSDSTNSYLHKILRGAGSKAEDNMPPGCATNFQSACLSSASRKVIAQWIQLGAHKTR